MQERESLEKKTAPGGADRQTSKHGDSMTELPSGVDSVKIKGNLCTQSIFTDPSDRPLPPIICHVCPPPSPLEEGNIYK